MGDRQVVRLQYCVQSPSTTVTTVALQQVEEIHPAKECLQTVDGIKTENGVDVLSEEDSTVMGMGEAHVLSMFPVEGAEPQMIDGIKTENDMGVLNEEDAAVMNTNEVRVPSTFSVQEAEPEDGMDVLKVEPASCCETCLTDAHNGNDVVTDIKLEGRQR